MIFLLWTKSLGEWRACEKVPFAEYDISSETFLALCDFLRHYNIPFLSSGTPRPETDAMIPNTRSAVMKAICGRLSRGSTREQVLLALAQKWQCTVTEIEAVESSGPFVQSPLYEPEGEEYEQRKAEAREIGANKHRQARIAETPRVEVQTVSFYETFGRQR